MPVRAFCEPEAVRGEWRSLLGGHRVAVIAGVDPSTGSSVELVLWESAWFELVKVLGAVPGIELAGAADVAAIADEAERRSNGHER